MLDSEMAVYGLYCVCDGCSRKRKRIRYIGQTRRSVRVRFRDHLKNSRYPNEHRIGGLPVYKWIRKHGEENIRVQVFQSDIAELEIDEVERDYIRRYKTFGGQGLNMTEGGLGKSGYRHSEETKKRIARKKIGIPGVSKSGLTDRQVQEIKTRLWCGETPSELAREFEVTKKTLTDISSGITKNHVPWPIGPRQRTRTRELRQKQMAGRDRDELGRMC